MSGSDGPVFVPQPEDATTFTYGASPEPSDGAASVEGQVNQRTLDTLAGEIAQGLWNFDGKSESEAKELRQRFWDENSATVRTKDHMDSNIFHVLARLEDKKFKKLKPLVYSVVEFCGELLKDKDKQQQTGLHSAIQYKNYRMVRQVLKGHDTHMKDRNFDDILKITSQNGNNLLHLTMKEMTPIPKSENEKLAIDGLIEKATPATLCMQNQDGFTPLHLAVEGEKCTPQQLDIVKKLVMQCEDALDIRQYNGKDIPSPYQHHRTTYEKWRMKKAPKQEEGQKPGHAGTNLQNLDKLHLSDQQPAKPDVHQFKNTERPMKTDTTNGPTQHNEKPTDGNGSLQTQKPTEGNSSLQSQKPTVDNGSLQEQKPIGYNDSIQALKPTPEMGNAIGKPRRQSTMGSEMRRKGLNGIVSAISQTRQPISPTTTTAEAQPSHPTQKTVRQSEKVKEMLTEGVTEKSAREVARFLKHTYLRKKSRQAALEFLYGGVSGESVYQSELYTCPDNQRASTEKQLDFNLYGKEGDISEEDFMAGYKCANLEDSLQFVRIPHLIIKPTPPPPLANGTADDPLMKSMEPIPLKDLAVGRTDLGIIFRWLRNDAEVEKIIKLIVDDLHHPAHSDEEIERAVKPFKVEIWDWRKIDLCCETIAEAAPNARQVKLYWSGNNAVLCGWSDPEGGLARLPDLERVVVFPQSVRASFKPRGSLLSHEYVTYLEDANW